MTRRSWSERDDDKFFAVLSLHPAEQQKLDDAASANWIAQRTQELGATAPVGNTSSVNTGDAMTRAQRNRSKYHE